MFIFNKLIMFEPIHNTVLKKHLSELRNIYNNKGQQIVYDIENEVKSVISKYAPVTNVTFIESKPRFEFLIDTPQVAIYVNVFMNLKSDFGFPKRLALKSLDGTFFENFEFIMYYSRL